MKKNKGFTLIELVFSVSILLVVVVASLSAIIGSALLIESSRNLATAACDAQYVLEQIKSQSFADIPSYISNFSPTRFSNLNNERVTFPNNIYTANLDTITVNITWTERNVNKTFSITSRFAQ